MRVERWTPGTPWGRPARPITWPRLTQEPSEAITEERNDTDTLKSGTGWMVTESIPATEPAKVTTPETGATTGSPWDAA
jgi:hypothetical protein